MPPKSELFLGARGANGELRMENGEWRMENGGRNGMKSKFPRFACNDVAHPEAVSKVFTVIMSLRA